MHSVMIAGPVLACVIGGVLFGMYARRVRLALALLGP